MNLRLPFLALLACFAFSVTAHASDIAFDITGGTFSPSGSFSGSFLINSTTELLDGASITAIAPSGGATYNFSRVGGDSSVPGLEILADGSGDTFVLALDGAINTLAVNSIPIWGTADTFFTLASGTRFDATAGLITDVSPAVTPEPSSLLLFGTGALGLAAFFRRRVNPNSNVLHEAKNPSRSSC
jgi:hypothetical protein